MGSNAANLSLVLGVSALIAPISGHLRTVRREGIVTMVAMVVVTWVMLDDELRLVEGIALLVAMAAASAIIVAWSRRDMAAGMPGLDIEGVEDGETYVVKTEVLRAGAGLVAIVVGATLLNQGGAIVANELGLTGGFIGATVFALGTSLPELVTAIAAARRGANDLVVGNVMGSNIFNSLLVVGIAATVGPGLLDERRVTELVIMLVIGVVAGLFVTSGNRLNRWEGAALVAAYGGFLVATAQMATI